MTSEVYYMLLIIILHNGIPLVVGNSTNKTTFTTTTDTTIATTASLVITDAEDFMVTLQRTTMATLTIPTTSSIMPTTTSYKAASISTTTKMSKPTSTAISLTTSKSTPRTSSITTSANKTTNITKIISTTLKPLTEESNETNSIVFSFNITALFVKLNTALNCTFFNSSSFPENETLYNVTWLKRCWNETVEENEEIPWYEDPKIYYIGGGAITGILIIIILRFIARFCSKYSGIYLVPLWKLPKKSKDQKMRDVWVSRHIVNLPAQRNV